MLFLAHTAHLQFLGLVVGVVAWLLTLATTGLNDWRMWYVEDVSVVTSGVAWVGIWRACFYSHALPKMEFCRFIWISDSFAPVEIQAAQVLMMLAVICGLAGNISGGMAMRMAYFSVEDRSSIKRKFLLAGSLYMLTALCSSVPLLLNLSSVLTNSTIDFPPEFFLPAAPVSQKVGSAIGVGIFASGLMIVCGLLFLCYAFTTKALRSEVVRETRPAPFTNGSEEPKWPNGSRRDQQGNDNPAYIAEEDL
ncbi:claudin-34 [Genypterus blacodes]|uniref:claudin-34 n=1 Tax=Genypterus blacodes TaxID=154954 RepID=UPI003F76A8C1